MNYKEKANEIEIIINEIRLIPYQFPLLSDLIKRRKEEKSKLYARITYNLMVFGKSAMMFDDIDYCLTKEADK
jgi:hypothetical protein